MAPHQLLGVTIFPGARIPMAAPDQSPRDVEKLLPDSPKAGSAREAGVRTSFEVAQKPPTCWDSCLQGCCWCFVVLVAVVLVLTLLLFLVLGPAGFTYYLDVLRIFRYGYGGAACMVSRDDCRTAQGFPGSDTDSTVTWYEEQAPSM